MKRFLQRVRSCMQDNRGLTLVELLIAVVIMGIVSIPLLHSFLSSANTEVKARRMGEATMVAQNVIECIEANEVEILLPEDTVAAGLAGVFEASGAKYYEWNGSAYNAYGTARPGATGTPEAGGEAGDEGAAGGEAGGGTGGEGAAEPKEYHVGVEGLSAGGQSYYAMIDYKRQSDPAVGGTVVDLVGINSAEISGYSSMDAVFQVPVNTEASERTITLNVNVGSTELTASLEYVIHTAGGSSEGGEAAGSGEGTGEEAAGESEAAGETKEISYESSYAAPVTADKVPAVYLFYYPNYKGEDTIVINHTGAAFELFLVKRIDPAYLQGEGAADDELALLANAEMAYHCKVSVTTSNPDHVTIHSNLTENLSYTAGNTAATQSIAHNIDWSLNGSAPASGFVKDALVSKEKKDRIYEVTVKIYDNANFTGDALCTITGSKLK